MKIQKFASGTAPIAQKTQKSRAFQIVLPIAAAIIFIGAARLNAQTSDSAKGQLPAPTVVKADTTAKKDTSSVWKDATKIGVDSSKVAQGAPKNNEYEIGVRYGPSGSWEISFSNYTYRFDTDKKVYPSLSGQLESEAMRAVTGRKNILEININDDILAKTTVNMDAALLVFVNGIIAFRPTSSSDDKIAYAVGRIAKGSTIQVVQRAPGKALVKIDGKAVWTVTDVGMYGIEINPCKH